MNGVARQHDFVCHSDGSVCEDGCDAPVLPGRMDALWAMLAQDDYSHLDVVVMRAGLADERYNSRVEAVQELERLGWEYVSCDVANDNGSRLLTYKSGVAKATVWVP